MTLTVNSAHTLDDLGTFTVRSVGAIREDYLTRDGRRVLPGERVLVALVALVAGIAWAATGSDPGGSLVWWAALFASVCAVVLAVAVWLQEETRRLLSLIAAALDLGTVPGVSRYTPSTPVPPGRAEPRHKLAGSLDTTAPPAAPSTRAARGLSNYGSEGVPPP